MTTQSKKLKKVRHFHAPGDCHELTFSCYKHWPLLDECQAYDLLAESIDVGLGKYRLNLSAYVFMPDHVHLLIWPEDPATAPISSFLKTVKLSLSTKVKRDLINHGRGNLIQRLTVQERPGKHCFRFWQEGPGCDRNLFSAQAVEASLDYIHTNPVKEGLCERADHWQWSSARYYHGQRMPEESKPRWTPLPAEFLT